MLIICEGEEQPRKAMLLKDVCVYAYIYFCSCWRKVAAVRSLTVLEARNLELKCPHCLMPSEGCMGESDFFFPASDNILIEGIMVNVMTLKKTDVKVLCDASSLKKNPNRKKKKKEQI